MKQVACQGPILKRGIADVNGLDGPPIVREIFRELKPGGISRSPVFPLFTPRAFPLSGSFGKVEIGRARRWKRQIT